MISSPAKESVDFIFARAAKANLLVSGDDSCVIEAVPKGKTLDVPGARIVVLTISSFTFRLLTIFHLDLDPRTRDYFTRGDANRDFTETFFELGNLCCGAMNRDLGNQFAHLGMSTPYMLDRACIPYISELKPGYVSQHKLTINGNITLHATLCLCAYAPLDFRIDMADSADTSGELEMF